MATIYEHCKLEADVCRAVARDPDITERMRISLVKSAEKWECVAGELSVEEGSKEVTDVDFWKLFEAKEREPEEVAKVTEEDDDDGEDDDED